MKKTMTLLITLTDDYNENRPDGKAPGQVVVSSVVERHKNLDTHDVTNLQARIVHTVVNAYCEQRQADVVTRDIFTGNYHDDDRSTHLN
jgi:hypothetical protein